MAIRVVHRRKRGCDSSLQYVSDLVLQRGVRGTAQLHLQDYSHLCRGLLAHLVLRHRGPHLRVVGLCYCGLLADLALFQFPLEGFESRWLLGLLKLLRLLGL
jgi:hypothetical protein